MSKRALQGRSQLKGNIGKTFGRSRGPMVYNEHVDRMVTPKIDDAIKNNRTKKSS